MDDLQINDMDGKSVKYAGIPVYMNGRFWIVPPLSIKQLKSYEKRINDMRGKTAEEVFDKIDGVLEIILDALRRNYPEVTKEDVEDMVDVGSLKQLMPAITKATGYRVASTSAGEASPMPESTGLSSSVQ